MVQEVWSFALAYFFFKKSIKHAMLARFISAIYEQSSELKESSGLCDLTSLHPLLFIIFDFKLGLRHEED